MKYASADLFDEHEGVLHGLKILEKMAKLVDSGTDVILSDIASMIEFLQLFADKCHHGKEEGILFPTMEKYGIPKDKGPIGQMLLEHEEGRKLIQGMSKSITNNQINKPEFVRNALGYIELLTAHIQKENTILFPMGDKVIPQTEQTRMIDAFENHEQTVMGPGIHDKLHAMLNAFEKKYL
jgi:hemerythrin-like domain-containing protein